LSPPLAAAPPSVRRAPLVHAPWTHAWWQGRADLVEIFGPPPSPTSLAAAAAAQSRRTLPAWTSWVQSASGRAPPADALVVLAGQQPVLAGGAALVAHKAATAVRLARDLSQSLRRPVVPVFLLADEDHDSSEVDHVDVVDEASGSLRRLRCALTPRSAPFKAAAWDADGLRAALAAVADLSGEHAGQLNRRFADVPAAPAAAHVAALLLDALGSHGLLCVEANRLTHAAAPILEAALAHPAWGSEALAEGARRLEGAGLRSSFDPTDPRPLLLETRELRRRRLEASDDGAARRFAAAPDAFSPHAALRPVVQAAALPVVAQVCGPSELLYLGQARALHGRFGVAPPVLVPRLEATRVTAAQLRELGGDLRGVDLEEAARRSHPLAAEERALLEAAERLARAVAQAAPELAGRARRWRAKAEGTARRLAAAPHWHGARGALWSALRPRGRPQDTVLAWLPDAWRAGRPAEWAARIVELCAPLDPPEHVLHLLPEEPAHG
jgi:bacillithiol synthase